MYIVSPRRNAPGNYSCTVVGFLLEDGSIDHTKASDGELWVLRGVSRTEKLGYLQPPRLPVPRRRQRAVATTALATRLAPLWSRRPRRADRFAEDIEP